MPFISFEGTEGMGKSTQLIRLAQHLQNAGATVVLTRQPGGTPLGFELRRVLLDPQQKPVPLAELFMYMADRVQHVTQVLQPELDQGRWVLCDRYSDATIAYQGAGRKLDMNQLLQMNQWATAGLVPDLTYLFDGDPATGLERARGRNLLDRIEQEDLVFFGKVRKGYLQLAEQEPERFVVLDALAEENVVYADVISGFERKFGDLGASASTY